MGKTAYAKGHTARGAVKAVTLHQFNAADVAEARAAVSVKRKLASENADEDAAVNALEKEVEYLRAQLKRECQAKGERIQQLRKQLVESERERESVSRQYGDQLKTRLRESHRLKEDLRIMMERASE